MKNTADSVRRQVEETWKTLELRKLSEELQRRSQPEGNETRRVPVTFEEIDKADAMRNGQPTFAELSGWTREESAAVSSAVEQGWEEGREKSNPVLEQIKNEISRLPIADEDASAPSTTPAGLTTANPAVRVNKFFRSGAVWSISYEGEAIQLPRLTGLEYIAVLLRNAGAEIFSSAVEALSKSDRAIISVSDSLQSYDNVTNGYIRDERLDSTARRQYKERALKVKEEILDARDRGDLNRVSTLESELGSIVEQLGADRGRGGRPRRERDDLERSRIRVTRAIIRAFGKITEQAPETARHLKANITTGTSMIYRDRITHWKL